MTKEQFIADIQRVYDELSARQAVLNDYFKLTHAKHQEADEIVEDFFSFHWTKKRCREHDGSTRAYREPQRRCARASTS